METVITLEEGIFKWQLLIMVISTSLALAREEKVPIINQHFRLKLVFTSQTLFIRAGILYKETDLTGIKLSTQVTVDEI